jgi:hypothetical protein
LPFKFNLQRYSAVAFVFNGFNIGSVLGGAYKLNPIQFTHSVKAPAFSTLAPIK